MLAQGGRSQWAPRLWRLLMNQVGLAPPGPLMCHDGRHLVLPHVIRTARTERRRAVNIPPPHYWASTLTIIRSDTISMNNYHLDPDGAQIWEEPLRGFQVLSAARVKSLNEVTRRWFNVVMSSHVCGDVISDETTELIFYIYSRTWKHQLIFYKRSQFSELNDSGRHGEIKKQPEVNVSVLVQGVSLRFKWNLIRTCSLCNFL